MIFYLRESNLKESMNFGSSKYIQFYSI